MNDFNTDYIVVTLATPFADGGGSAESWVMAPQYAPAIRALMEKYAVPAGETYAPNVQGAVVFRGDVIDIPANGQTP